MKHHDNRSSDLSEGLIKSSVKVLRQALDSVQAEPQLAALYFGVGAELFLKARLAFEHWVLLVESKRGKVNENNPAQPIGDGLLRGNNKTIGPADTFTRLVEILPPSESRTWKSSWRKLKAVIEHRNMAAHFFLESSHHSPDSVAAAQFGALGVLEKIWKSSPGAFRSNVDSDWTALLKSDIQKRFAHHARVIRNGLSEDHDKGKAIGVCLECSRFGISEENWDVHRKGIYGKVNPVVYSCECIVCQSVGNYAKHTCNECGKPTALSLSWERGSPFLYECFTDNCEGAEELDLIPGIEEYIEIDTDDYPPVNYEGDTFCGYCEESNLEQFKWGNTIVTVCRSCGEIGDHIADTSSCGSCSAKWFLCDMESSSFMGCPECSDSLVRH